MTHVYLDNNATTPLRPEARIAMIDAMDITGNPSSVHFNGRAAKSLLERSRDEIGEALGLSNDELVFTSGAAEAAALALTHGEFRCAALEHPTVKAHCHQDIDATGGIIAEAGENVARQHANSETGILQTGTPKLWLEDIVQSAGKVPYAFSFRNAKTAMISAHKFGGPKGVGALLFRKDVDLTPVIRGGGQEGNRRAGTENLIGIAGMAAAIKAATHDLSQGRWDEVRALRDHLEAILLDGANDIAIVGRDLDRLPNTTNILTKGWRGETQVLQMDLAGFSISAGSACSSGKSRPSTTMTAMGYDDDEAQSNVRISLGFETTKNEIEAFATTWLQAYSKWKSRAA